MARRNVEKRHKGLAIKAVEATVLFVREAGELKQVVNLTIGNPGPPVEASLSVAFGSREERVMVGRVPRGETTHAVHLPDIREKIPVCLELLADGKCHDTHEMAWAPRRHWHVHVVHTSHHDWGYTDLPSRVLREHDEFMDTVLRFCDETDHFPDDAKFRYTVEQSWSIVHTLRNRDEGTVRRLVERIREGRIEVTALFGNQTSELCGHEELIRLLYPSFELKRSHGIPVRTAELNDVPGLSWGLASVLAGAGVRYFSFGMPKWYFGHPPNSVHPLWDEEAVLPNGVPDAFWWVGPDGSKVLVWLGTSGPVGDYDEALNGLPGLLSDLESRGYPFGAVRFGVIGGGRDNAPPSARFAYVAREWNARWAYPRLIMSTNACFFDRIAPQAEGRIRTFRGELPNTDYTVGATSTARETAVNRVAHDELASAERFATIAAAVADHHYPAEQIREAYEQMLLYDEHTWGTAWPAGPAQDASWAEKGALALRAAALAHDALSKGLNRIADHIGLADDGCHVVVFNPLAWKRTDVATVPLRQMRPCGRPMHLVCPQGAAPPRLVSGCAVGRDIVDLPAGDFDLVDAETGRAVPFEVVELGGPQAPVPFAAHRHAMGQFDPPRLREIVFLARDVPSMGYKTYRVVPRSDKRASRSSVKVGETTLESRFFKVELDPRTGAVASIFDKELDRELVDPTAPHQLNQLVARTSADSTEHVPAESDIRKGRLGPVAGSLVVTGDGLGCPQRTQEITLYDRIKRIDFANRLLKDSTPQVELYFAFPFRIRRPRFRFEGADSVIEPLRDQFPGSNTNTYTAQHWVSVGEGDSPPKAKGTVPFGIAWSSRDAHIVGLGGLWPLYVSFAHHGVTPPNFGQPFLGPGELKHGHIYSCVLTSNYRTNFAPAQTGDLLFRYSITAHGGDPSACRARDFGWGVCNPLAPVCVSGKQQGALPPATSFAKAAPANVLLLTLKRAEDGHGLIVRLIETAGAATEATVELPFVEFAEAYATNLVEENETLLRASRHAVAVPIRPYGIATIRIVPRCNAGCPLR